MQDILILIAVIAFILALLILFKQMTPRCPICGGRLESVGTPRIIKHWWSWNLVSRQFVCIECPYQQNRIEITRTPPARESETSSVH